MIQLAISEAGYTAVSRPGRFLLQVLLLAAIVTSAALLDAASTSDVEEQYRRARQAGADVIVVKAADEHANLAPPCDHLAAATAIQTTGKLARGATRRPDSAPGVALSTAHVTPGFLRIADPGVRAVRPGHIVVGAFAADQLGVQEGAMLAFDGRVERISETASLESRDPDRDGWLFAIEADVPATECWVEAKPGRRTAALTAARAAFSGQDVAVTTLTKAEATSHLVSWRDQPERHAWAGAALMGAVVVAICLLPRRGELALRRTLGASRLVVALQIAAEIALIVLLAAGLAAIWGWCLLSVIRAPSAITSRRLVETIVLAVAPVISLSPFLALAVMGRGLASLLRQQ